MTGKNRTGGKDDEPPFSSPEAKAKIKKSEKAAKKFEARIKDIIEDAREEEKEAEKKNRREENNPICVLDVPSHLGKTNKA